MDKREPSYLFTPFDGRPGKSFDQWEEDLLSAGSGIVDDRGWSVGDCLNGNDEGGPTGTPINAATGTAAEQRKAHNARRKRLKEAYNLIHRHQTDPTIKNELATNHFQNPTTALTYLQSFRSPVDLLSLRDNTKEWESVDILSDVGVNEHTITLLVNYLRLINNIT